jgi:signal transduction histidine kinase
VLLEQWHREHNTYEAAKKQAVLRHLALFNQDGSVENKSDWRTMKMETVLAEIKKVLPDLNLTNKDAAPLLEEIVNRSGLLQKIDGGERYQFAHLTLQEFFATVALRDDVTGMLTRFKANPDTWREAVKIWCGLDHDSTDLIRAIYAEDSIMAFECIADAQQVSADLADEIIGYFKSQLGSEGEAINRAFAAVASNTTERGKAIFNYLVDILANTEEDKQRRVIAANILSMTNLEEAAKVLAKHYYYNKNISNELRVALLSMGDLAAPMLEKFNIDQEAELRRSRQMVTVAKMASSLAHEIMQPLQIILMKADNCSWEVEHDKIDKTGIIKDLKNITDTTQRISHIVKRLRILSQEHKLKLELVDINNVIENTFMDFSEQLKSRHIHLEKNLTNSLPLIKADKIQLEQVVIILISNARDALEGCDNKRIAISTQLHNNQVLFQLTDNGVGIASEKLSNIFEAFMTTKEKTGMGLGLHIAKDIIQAYDGKISVDSDINKATTFSVTFPIATEE